jgi:hypothetical protein
VSFQKASQLFICTTGGLMMFSFFSISAKPVGAGAAYQLLIRREQSGLLTHIAATIPVVMEEG